MRKVHSILLAQLSLSTVTAGFMMYNENFKSWVQTKYVHLFDFFNDYELDLVYHLLNIYFI